MSLYISHSLHLKESLFGFSGTLSIHLKGRGISGGGGGGSAEFL